MRRHDEALSERVDCVSFNQRELELEKFLACLARVELCLEITEIVGGILRFDRAELGQRLMNCRGGMERVLIIDGVGLRERLPEVELGAESTCRIEQLYKPGEPGGAPP